MATIKDIANKLNISTGTVSKGLNGANDISEALRHQILDTAAELGYTKRGAARPENRKLCIFVENMDYYLEDDFGYDIILGFKQAAFSESWAVEVIPISHLVQERHTYDRFMISQGFSGAFILGFAYDDPWMSFFGNTHIPTVIFDHYLTGNPMVGFVGSDSEEGIGLAVSHLTSLGHSKIAFLSGEETSMISEFRLNAFHGSMKAHGLPLMPGLYAAGSYSTGADDDTVMSLISAGATAIICGSDIIAYSVIRICKEHGISIPDSVSVVGYDDLPASASTIPALTTVRQDRLMIGKSGYYSLYAIIQGVTLSRNLIRPTLVVRNSTSPVTP
ncbi:MAG: LacI family DNA-binding transcriptional regulator [Lachnospiraceae bacterium]|nr:LacI family DNA-binding transcriptional regulator [Lachnospiraceae bacterium]